MAAGLVDHAAQVLIAHAADPTLHKDLPELADEVVRLRLVLLVQLPGFLRQPTQRKDNAEHQHYSLDLIPREILMDQGDHPILAGRDQSRLVATDFRSFPFELAQDSTLGWIRNIVFLQFFTAH